MINKLNLNNVYLLCGDELVFKDLRFNNIVSKLDDFELKTVHIESYRTKKLDLIYKEINEFLNTYSLFSSLKVLRVVVYQPEQVKQILKNTLDVESNSILVIDLRCSEYICRKTLNWIADKNIEIEKFYKFKDYEKEKVFEFIKGYLLKNNIKFKSDKDLFLTVNHIFDNAQYSYDTICLQVQKLKVLNCENYTFENVSRVIGTLPSKNNYRICDEIFHAKNINQMICYMEKNNLYSLNQKSFLNLISILLDKLNDYNLFINDLKCSIKANYYVFKDTSIIIEDCRGLILELNKLSIDIKKGNNLLVEEFLLILIKYINYEEDVNSVVE